MGLEDELRKVYRAAAQLTAVDELVAQDMPALAVPAEPVRRRAGKEIAAEHRTSAPLGANPTKLLAHLHRTLNANDFSAVNLTRTASETGLPLGSMSAAVKKLLETGRMLSGPAGSLKLATSGSVTPLESQPALQA